MTKQDATAAPLSGTVTELSKSDSEPNGSETGVHKPGFLATQREGVTFDTAGLDDYYKPMDQYEGLHRFDPKFEWEPSEERKVVRKVYHLSSHQLFLC